ncbi:MAG: rRNA cytosine-C5-methyltransferase [Muribaculaceae bacterium]|nr:rRNA cytosine-C5-methyltransferase [Muribaculaceae bacterium]
MALPELFIRQIEELLPENEAKALIAALGESEPSISIRLNASKCERPPISNTVPWCKLGFYLKERPQFTFDPMLHSGSYYVQDASSMFLAYAIDKLVDKSAPVKYLDLCAAPGGKTTTAIDTLPQGSLIVANEIMSGRAQILRENIIKWGNPYCIVTNNDSASFARLTHYFDIIAADVPCSGEGMMRKDADAIAQWTPTLVTECSERQREIANNAWQALRPGGLFIYSTCTFNRKENEEIIEYLVNELGAESIKIEIPQEWNIYPAIDSHIHGYHFFPHRTHGEGLFLAVVRKPDNEPIQPMKPIKSKKNKKEKPQPIPIELQKWGIIPQSFQLVSNSDIFNAIPAKYSDEIGILQEHLKVICLGCEIAGTKGRDLIPAHALALNANFTTDIFPQFEVDYATAIAYLRGETITIDAPRGYVIITYNGRNLGFVKNLGNRANNLYPKEWRIKSTHIPTSSPAII